MNKNLAYYSIAALFITGIIMALLKPKFIMPVGKYRITSKYGEKRGVNKTHNGIDLAPEIKGTPNVPILASASGTVVNAWNDTANGGGNSVVIKHSLGWQTGYAHMASFSVKKGDKVTQGQQIGIMGNTGESTGPHLHFTMRNNLGVRVDPLSQIKA